MFFRKGQALGSVQITDSGEPDETQASSVDEVLGSLASSAPAIPNIAGVKDEAPKDPPAIERPKVGDLKADWIEYAVSKGMDRELAEDDSTTKQDLIDSYGG